MDQDSTVDQLVDLGFSQYEARAYVGLLGQDPMTGYALANRTRIPQPKVYETLRRLTDKRAVVQIGNEPARFIAVPADHLLKQFDADFRRRLAEAKLGLAEVGRPAADEEPRVLRSPRGWAAVARTAIDLVDRAERHVYASTHADQLAEIADAVGRADDRGVRVDLLCFGRNSLRLKNGRVLHHATTEGMIYRHHQARHLAVVVDNEDTLWALAPDGTEWDAVAAADPLVAALVKGYIRHDLYVQEIFQDFREQLLNRYGPGLDRLVTPHVESIQPSKARRRRSA